MQTPTVKWNWLRHDDRITDGETTVAPHAVEVTVFNGLLMVFVSGGHIRKDGQPSLRGSRTVEVSTTLAQQPAWLRDMVTTARSMLVGGGFLR